eukprot:1146914-Pelagomonas_calceolata.AAC.28
MMVDSSNLGAWIDAVVDATLGSGVASQLAACSQGFNEAYAHQKHQYSDLAVFVAAAALSSTCVALFVFAVACTQQWFFSVFS